MEIKARPCEFKVDMDERTFSGYASTFGNVDQGDDRVLKGAFKKTIRERFNSKPRPKIKVLWQHYDPLGLPTAMDEDDKGLVVTGRVSRTQLGDDALELMRDGVVDSMSIGYATLRFKYSDLDGRRIRDLQELKLMEFSPVTFPMNEAAVITAVKNLERAAGYGLEGSVAILDRNPQDLKLFADSIGVGVLDLVRALSSGQALIGSGDASESKAVTRFQDLPIADRELAWDSAEAEKRVRDWADAQDEPEAKYLAAFVWSDPTEPGAHKLQIADAIGGELVAVPAAIFAAAGEVQGASKGIPDGDVGDIRAHLGSYYKKMAAEFDDGGLIAPWDQDDATSADDLKAKIKTAIARAESVLGDLASSLESLVQAKPAPATLPASEPGAGGDEGLQSIASTIENFQTFIRDRLN